MEVTIDLVNIVLLESELVDLVPEFFIIGDRGVQLLVSLL